MKTNIAPLQVQKPILAPTMQQSIQVLLLPLMDLNLAIEQELQNNPMLEIDESLNTAAGSEPTDREIQKILNEYPRAPEMMSQWSSDDDEQDERPIAKPTSLEDLLLKQIRLEVTTPLQLKIAEHIIGNINEDGYLTVTPNEIAQSLGLHDETPVQEILEKIQSFEPTGIASRDLTECLRTQLKTKYRNPDPTALKIIEDHLTDLGRKQYQKIARKLGVGFEEIKTAAHVIATLDPKPARNYRPIDTHIYVKPDIFIKKDAREEYQITVNKHGIPGIRINPFYKNMLKKTCLSPDERQYIKEKLKNAASFIKSIELRGHTITEIAKQIVQKQKDFFDGEHFAIAPLTLKDVARQIGRNESTVCRAINNKYIDTPQGIFPLKFFFSQAVHDKSNGNGTATSSRGVKEELLNLIEEEDKASPLSDSDIQNHFEKKGTKLARRTITKYRKELKILASHLRRE